MKVLVCGGRNYTNADQLDQVLSGIARISMIIHGGARGADTLAGTWAQENGIAEVVVPAQWGLGRGAGILRNGWMLQLEPQLVVAFPGGRGTANMVMQARRAGLEVYDVNG